MIIRYTDPNEPISKMECHKGFGSCSFEVGDKTLHSLGIFSANEMCSSKYQIPAESHEATNVVKVASSTYQK